MKNRWKIVCWILYPRDKNTICDLCDKPICSVLDFIYIVLDLIFYIQERKIKYPFREHRQVVSAHCLQWKEAKIKREQVVTIWISFELGNLIFKMSFSKCLICTDPETSDNLIFMCSNCAVSVRPYAMLWVRKAPKHMDKWLEVFTLQFWLFSPDLWAMYSGRWSDEKNNWRKMGSCDMCSVHWWRQVFGHYPYGTSGHFGNLGQNSEWEMCHLHHNKTNLLQVFEAGVSKLDPHHLFPEKQLPPRSRQQNKWQARISRLLRWA